MSKVLHRNGISQLPTVAFGDGAYLIDSTGKRYLDACGGAAISCLGHSNEAVKRAISDQLNKVSFAHTSFFTNDPQEELAEHLISHGPEGFSSIYFVSGGSEAVETALKLARQYFVEIGLNQKKYIIARKQSYHGNTLGALSVGGNLWRRKIFDPILMPGNHISACYAYRDKRISETEFEYGQRVANELESEILKLGEESVAAFIAEPIVGATSGALVPVEGYFKRIREICDQYNVLLILDEVMCGMGRTGHLHASEMEGIKADLKPVAKGIAGGYQPLGAVFVSKKIHNAIAQGSGSFQHGYSFIGHATACAAGLAVQKEIQEKKLLSNVKKQGKILKQTLEDFALNNPYIGDVRGRGLFIGVELVADKNSKAPFPPEDKIHTKVKQCAMDNGLMIYTMPGTIDGRLGNHILLAPPFIINNDQIDQISTKLISAINDSV